MTEPITRPKELKSETFHIKTESCGTLHVTVGSLDTDKVIEVRAVIGKNQVCSAILLDSFAKMVSTYLQSSEPRYRIVKKLRHLFLPDTKGNSISCTGGGKSCIELIIEKIVDRIE